MAVPTVVVGISGLTQAPLARTLSDACRPGGRARSVLRCVAWRTRGRLPEFSGAKVRARSSRPAPPHRCRRPVARRGGRPRAAGLVNRADQRTSRSLVEIARANLLTRFNAILGTMFVLILVFGAPQDGLFGFVLVANAVLGIGQEWRAKRTLDRLAVLSAPRARVVRDGAAREIAVVRRRARRPARAPDRRSGRCRRDRARVRRGSRSTKRC